MRFVAGPPSFAVEVCSEGDDRLAAEYALAAKQADYFEAGTLVVWDLDPIAECIRIYRTEAPDQPIKLGQNQRRRRRTDGFRLASVDRLDLWIGGEAVDVGVD